MIQTSRFIGTLALLLAVSAPVAQAQEVNVYSYRQPFLIEPVLDAFTDSTGIKVNMVYAKKGLIQRLESEGANSPADLMLTADIGLLLDAKEKGLTQAMSSPVLSNRIPAEFRDSEEHWYGLTSRARIIVASKDRVQPGEIANYEDLTDSKWKGRICTRSGKHPYMVLLIASMVANNGKEQAGEWVKGIKANLARKPQGNDRAQVKAIKEGVCDVAIINHYYMAKMLDNEEQIPWAQSVNVVFPNQGNRGTHMNISGVVLTANSPNQEAAQQLVEFMVSDDAQQIYAQTNSEFPVVGGIALSPLLDSWGPFKKDAKPLSASSRFRKEAIVLVDEALYDF